MALDPNIGRIKFLRSKTAGRKPTTADLDEGELAINLADRTLYTSTGTAIVDLGFAKGGEVNGDITQTGNITTSGTIKATKLEGPLTGNADSATKLQNTRTLSWTGDATGSLSFNGSANVSAALTLANSGVTAGTYKSVTVDTKGRVTAGSDVITGLVTSTAASGTTNAATSNTNTYLNIVETIGSAVTTVGTSTQVTGAGTVTVTSDTAGKLTITGSQNITGSATSITVQGNTTALEGTQLPPDGFRVVRAYSNGYPAPYGNVLQVGGTGQNEVLLGWSGADGGVADTFIRNKRDTASAPWSNWRKVVFEDALNSLTVDKANSLVTARTINGVAFNGTANIVIADSTKLPLTGGTLTGGLTAPNLTATGSIKTITLNATGAGDYSPSGQGAYLSWNRNVGSGKTDFINNRGGGPGGFDWWNGTESSYTQVMSLDSNGVLSAIGGFNGNAATATKLQTARTINGVSFDGSANITIADNTKLPLTGGTITGNLNANALGVNNTASIGGLGLSLYGGSSAGMPEYGLAFSGTATFGTHGGVGGDWATYFTMGGATNRGWIFKSGNGAGGNVASISAAGAITATSILSSGTVTAPTFSGALSGNATTASSLATARMINGVSFNGTANITIADSTKLPLTGGTISGNLQIHNGLIVRNDVLVEGGIQGKTVRNRTGLDEKMYWIGAWNRPDQTNVVVTPVDANTLSFRINIQSGSMYIVNGVSQIHMLTGWGDGVNAKFINPVIMSTTDVNAGKQVIDVIANQPNHGITVATNYFWHALTYESYGCKIDKWGGHIGNTRFLVRLKCDEKFVMKAPLVSATSTSNNWFSGTQSGLDYPLQHSSYAVIVPTSIVEEQVVIWNVIENNTDALANNCPYVSIVVKDRIA
ncbi:tail fiber protein [Acinetobacter phage 133]|uniref:Probably gp37-like tail fiber protein n=1 Tax=Acinetobacter phage 133 TaxID=2919552 RepID=D9I6I2_9CAUD|nr:tail fiber protein [Acinetobacter phage 133]ADJ19563.1 probably gp37-like tail fiber protein [Acinetobacter phage 133]